MVESASAENVPYDVLKKQPHWFNQQISDYLEEFVGAPAPDPLETWRRNAPRGDGGGTEGAGRSRGFYQGRGSQGFGYRGGTVREDGAALLIALASSGAMKSPPRRSGGSMARACVWALRLKLPELFRWARLIPKVKEHENGR